MLSNKKINENQPYGTFAEVSLITFTEMRIWKAYAE